MRGLKPPKRRERPNSVFAAQVRIASPTPDLSAYAPLASPALTGTPTAPTPASGDNSTALATTAYVDAAVAAAGGSMVTRIASGTVAGLTVVNSVTGTLFDTPRDLSAYRQVLWRFTRSGTVTKPIALCLFSVDVNGVVDTAVGDAFQTVQASTASKEYSGYLSPFGNHAALGDTIHSTLKAYTAPPPMSAHLGFYNAGSAAEDMYCDWELWGWS